MKFHWGEPEKLLTLSGTSCWTSTGKDKAQPWIAHRFIRPILSWVGFSWRGSWFIGFIRTGEQVGETHAELPPSEREDKRG